jgi:hypothetical protein
MRSTSPIAALILTEAPGLPPLLTGPVAAGVAGLGVTGELQQDKLPSTPYRFERRGLVVFTRGLLRPTPIFQLHMAVREHKGLG